MLHHQQPCRCSLLVTLNDYHCDNRRKGFTVCYQVTGQYWNIVAVSANWDNHQDSKVFNMKYAAGLLLYMQVVGTTTLL